MPRTGTSMDLYQSYLLLSLSILPISTKRINRKIPLNAPFVILNTGKEENIHFAVSRRIRKKTERTISR